MKRLFPIAAAGMLFASLPALAQFVPPPPELQNRIPAPLPPPPQPPPSIYDQPAQGPAPRVYQPQRLRTFGDRVSRCREEGTSYGLRGGKLESFARRCANVN